MIIRDMMIAAHENAVIKGFGNTARNQKETLQLILSELGEATEAHRKGVYANISAFEGIVEGHNDDIDLFKATFEAHIKDSYEDELADTMIRIGNYIKEFGVHQDIEDRDIEIRIVDNRQNVVYESDVLSIDIATYIEEAGKLEKEEFNSGECLFNISYAITRTVDSPAASHIKNPADRFGDAIIGILNLAVLEGIDLEKFIELKMKYNTTREYLHGKNY